MGTTSGVAFVFYGLKGMTEQLEKPMETDTEGFELFTIFRSMFAKLENAERVREECLQYLKNRKMEGVEVSEHLHDSFMDQCEQEMSTRSHVKKYVQNRQNLL